MDHRDEALRHLQRVEAGDEDALVEAATAAVHALLHLSESVRHGLRDLVYELRS